MQIKLIHVFAVHQGDTDCSVGSPTWFFYSQAEANEAAKGRGWYGGNAPVRSYDALSIYDDKQPGYLSGAHVDKPATVYLLRQAEPLAMDVGPEDPRVLRENALAKLTDVEKQILGLSK